VHFNSVESDGDTPLHVMLRRNDNEAVLMLLKAGANVDAIGDMSETPLHVAVRQQNLVAAEALVRAGADPDVLSDFGETPRTMASKHAPKLCSLFVTKEKRRP
jgi:ankyrin repeat protein